MLNVDKRAVFQSRLSGKNVDLGVLSPSPEHYNALLAEMAEIGMLIPQAELEGAYKVNVPFSYDTLGSDGSVIEQDFDLGEIVGLNNSGDFVLEDKRGDLFVAQMNAQAEADKDALAGSEQ